MRTVEEFASRPALRLGVIDDATADPNDNSILVLQGATLALVFFYPQIALWLPKAIGW